MGSSESTGRSNGGETNRSNGAPRPFKLKTDGACRPDIPNGDDDGVLRGPSGYAGVLEDDRGNFVRGFRGFIGVSDCFTAEIHGILKGLEFLDKRGYKGFILENDSQAAVDWVTQEGDAAGKSRIVRECWDLITKSRQLVRKNNIEVRCCSRNANKHADKLAGIAIEKRQRYVEFPDGTPSMGAAAAIGTAAAAIGTVAVVAWGVKRMLSDDNPADKWGQVKNEMNGAFRALGLDHGSSSTTTTTTCSSASPRPLKLLKTDGACLHNHGEGPSGYAGVLEDDLGNLVGGFRGFIGESDSFTAEIHGILKGLEFLDKRGYKGLILENDFQEAVNWVSTRERDAAGKSDVVCECWDLIKESRDLISKNNIEVRYCSRNDNKHADKLARIAIRKRHEGYVEFTDVDREINSLD